MIGVKKQKNKKQQQRDLSGFVSRAPSLQQAVQHSAHAQCRHYNSAIKKHCSLGFVNTDCLLFTGQEESLVSKEKEIEEPALCACQ